MVRSEQTQYTHFATRTGKENALKSSETESGHGLLRYDLPTRMRFFRTMLCITALAVYSIFAGVGPASAVEVGEPAPEFTMPSTMGGNVSLSDYRDKKWVLLEFYGADFAPT
jgi:hypothetical protein